MYGLLCLRVVTPIRAGGGQVDTARGHAGSAEVSAEERNNAHLAALQRAQAELDSLVAGRVRLAQALHSAKASAVALTSVCRLQRSG